MFHYERDMIHVLVKYTIFLSTNLNHLTYLSVEKLGYLQHIPTNHTLDQSNVNEVYLQGNRSIHVTACCLLHSAVCHKNLENIHALHQSGSPGHFHCRLQRDIK